MPSGSRPTVSKMGFLVPNWINSIIILFTNNSFKRHLLIALLLLLKYSNYDVYLFSLHVAKARDFNICLAAANA